MYESDFDLERTDCFGHTNFFSDDGEVGYICIKAHWEYGIGSWNRLVKEVIITDIHEFLHNFVTVNHLGDDELYDLYHSGIKKFEKAVTQTERIIEDALFNFNAKTASMFSQPKTQTKLDTFL